MSSCDGSNSTLWHLARFPRLRQGKRDREVAQLASLGIHAERLNAAADGFRNLEDAVVRTQVEVLDTDIVLRVSRRPSLKPLLRIPHWDAQLQTLRHVDGNVSFQQTFEAAGDPFQAVKFLRSRRPTSEIIHLRGSPGRYLPANMGLDKDQSTCRMVSRDLRYDSEHNV